MAPTDRTGKTTAHMYAQETSRLYKPVMSMAVLGLLGLNLVLDLGCHAGWASSACTDIGFTTYPAYGAGETLLSEVISVFLCLFGIFLALASYLHGRAQMTRISVVFLMLFIVAFVGENNLMRDDLRPQFLVVILVWLGIELLLRRSFLPIILLLIGCIVGFIGTVADHSTHAVYQNFAQQEVSDSFFAPLVPLFGKAEEFLEMGGWIFFALAAIAALDIRMPRIHPTRFLALGMVAVVLLAFGVSFLHIRDNDAFETARKLAFFTTVAGIALGSATAFRTYGSQSFVARAYCGLFALALYWLCLFTPAVYTHEHSKTISSWTWIIPLLSMHWFMVTSARIQQQKPVPDTA